MRWTRRSPATPPASRSRSSAGNRLTVTDNGRGIPVDPHPKYPGQSALEVIMTTLHSGGKFEGKAYSTSAASTASGSASSTRCRARPLVEVARDKTPLPPDASPRGLAASKLEKVGAAPNRRGTTVSLHPRPRDFRRRRALRPARLHRLARSKAYLFAGVEIRWRCDPSLASADVPEAAVFQFPGGLADHLAEQLGERECVTAQPFTGRQDFPPATDGIQGSAEWAVAWPLWSRRQPKAIIATPSRPPTAAPTRRACAPR